MKRIYAFFILIAATAIVQAQVSPVMYTSGNTLYDVCGSPVTLRGINYAPFNWGFDANYDKFAQLEQTGANCVRLPWYRSSASGGGAPVYDNLALLDSAITRCARHKMIPILELHDQTCANNPSQLIALTGFYTQPAMLTLINKHKAYLVINVANEALYVMWGGSSSVFMETYFTIIDSLRGHDIHVPIMIDASDCGQHSDLFASIGNQLKMHDPDTNIIFSSHAYWYAYASNMDSVAVRGKLQTMVNTGLPFVLGEVANLQSNGSDECFYSINYKPMLRICQEMQIGWMGWSWDHDVCASRQMSTNGNVASLTPYGNDLVNNPDYGLVNAVRSSYLLNNMSCASGMGIPQVTEELTITAARQGENIFIHNAGEEKVTISVYDILGREWLQKNVLPGEYFSFSDPFTGIKYIRCIQQQKGWMKTLKVY